MSAQAPLGDDPMDIHVTTSRGPLMTKRFIGRDDGSVECQQYGLAANFSSEFWRPRDLRDVRDICRTLQHRPRSAVVRAALRPGVDPRRHKRTVLSHTDRDGVAHEPHMIDVPRGWVAFDWDDLPTDDDWYQPAKFADVARRNRRNLPAPFHRVGSVIVASSSAGIKPGARFREWFLLAKPLFGHQIRRALGENCPVDPVTLLPAQVCYTAAPLFEGLPDPVAIRVHELWLDTDLVELEAPTEATKPLVAPSSGPSFLGMPLSVPRPYDGERSLTLDVIADRMRRKPKGGRHAALFGNAWRAFDLLRDGETSAHHIFFELAKAARDAGLTDPDEELRRIIKRGLERGAGGSV